MTTRRTSFTWLFPLWLASLAACSSAPPQSDAVADGRTPAPAAVATEVAPAVVVERLIELGRNDNHVQDHLHYLCSKIGPRLTSSAKLQEACEWTRDQFASFGLDASIERWGEFPVGFDRGPWRGGMLAPEKLDFEFHTMAWTPGTNGPVRGRAIPFPTTEEELAAMQERIAGAWLVRPPAAALKNEAGDEVFAKPVQPSNELIEKVQDLIVEKGGLGEVRGSRSELLVTDGNSRLKWDELPKLVQIRVRKDHHDQLWQRLGASDPVELEFDVDNRFVNGPIPLYNVVADWVGSAKPDEYVIVCGHLDSWDGAEGAVDNGTGCATTLEAARLLVQSGARPARTIRFILWSGEEQGLLGSEAYVKQHPELLPKISAVFNHDEGTNYLSGLGVTKEMLPAMRIACASLADLHPEFKFELREIDGLPTMGMSDHAAFTQAGVPGFFWRQSGRSNYNHHHHTQYDTFDGAIPEYQKHSALVAALVAYNVANLPELLDRTNMAAPAPRRMGVQLEGTKLTHVIDDGRAKAAGLEVGDVVLAIDGKEMKSQGSITSAVREGGAQKVFKVRRGEGELELTLDWSSDPDEARRAARAKEREEREAARKAEAAAKKLEGDAKKTEDGSKP